MTATAANVLQAGNSWRLFITARGSYVIALNPDTAEDALPVAIACILSPEQAKLWTLEADGVDADGWERWLIEPCI